MDIMSVNQYYSFTLEYTFLFLHKKSTAELSFYGRRDFELKWVTISQFHQSIYSAWKFRHLKCCFIYHHHTEIDPLISPRTAPKRQFRIYISRYTIYTSIFISVTVNPSKHIFFIAGTHHTPIKYKLRVNDSKAEHFFFVIMWLIDNVFRITIMRYENVFGCCCKFIVIYSWSLLYILWWYTFSILVWKKNPNHHRIDYYSVCVRSNAIKVWIIIYINTFQ